MKKFRSKKDFIDKGKRNLIKASPKEVLRQLEEELIDDVRIAKEDIENVAFWNIPDTPEEFNSFIKKYPSVCIYWGMLYNAQFRKAKAADRRHTNYILSKRDKCFKAYKKARSDGKGKISKQPTKEDYDQQFRKLYGKKKKYLKLIRSMEKEKEVRDKLETIYMGAKLFKDILVVSGNLLINMMNKGLIPIRTFDNNKD